MSFIADASSSTDAAGGGGIKHYTYTFGDGTTESSSQSTAGHVYASHGTYPCTVTVTNKKGKSNTCPPVTATVTVVPPVEPPDPPDPPDPPSTDLLPEPYRTVWAPGVRVVPPRDVYAILNTGDAAFIQDAINSAPLGLIVGLGDGNFPCNDFVSLNRGVTLRGNGPGRTFLERTNGAQTTPGWTGYPLEEADPVIVIGPHRWPSVDSTTSVNLAVDGMKGDYAITVVVTSGLAPGQFVFLDRDDYTTASWLPCPPRSNGAQSQFWGTDMVAFAKHNPPDPHDDPFPDSLSWFSRPGRPVCEIKEIASVAGNVVLFTTPLHASYPVSRLAQLSRFNMVHVQGAGLEDLTVLGGADGNVIFNAAAHCWMRNVESTQWLGRGVRALQSFRCTIRDSYLHTGVHPYPGGGGYNLALGVGASEILIENCISIGTNKNMVVESAGAGCVVAYNYMDNAQIGNNLGWVEVGINGSHMVGGHHILFEGNQAPNYDSDDTHGNAVCMTVFRNHLTGQRRDFTDVQNVRCAGLMFGSWWHALIGNVLGREGEMDGWSYEWVERSIFKLGYAPALWDQGVFQDADPKVLATVLRDGNFDYLTGLAHWDRPVQPLPDSLYLTAKPAFFGDLAWPWVDALGAVKVGLLPARARYDHGTS